jgi:hypothetical protein
MGAHLALAQAARVTPPAASPLSLLLPLALLAGCALALRKR